MSIYKGEDILPASSENPSAPITLETVKAQFAHWRATRTKIEKIPESLWDNVRKLAKSHGQGQIATELGLNGTQLRNKLACTPAESSANKVASPSFVAASFLPLLPNSSQSLSTPKEKILHPY